MLTASNYNDRCARVALCCTCLPSLSGSAAPLRLARSCRRSPRQCNTGSLSRSYVAGGLVLTTLFGMALLGPRPSGFFARFARGGGDARTDPLRRSACFEPSPVDVLAPIAAGGLALLFWEARDGTRAA